MIKIGIKGLAKFMTGTATQQRKVLRNYKYPDPEGSAQAVYYREARDGIEVFHGKGNDLIWLNEQAAYIKDYASKATQQAASRLNNNARALRQYGLHFGKKCFEVQKPVKLRLGIEGVLIIVTPDLHVIEKGSEKLIKLEFGKGPFQSSVPKILCQAMFEASKLNDMKIKYNCINYFDVATGKVFQSGPSNSRVMKNIQDACKNIEAIWDSI